MEPFIQGAAGVARMRNASWGEEVAAGACARHVGRCGAAGGSETGGSSPKQRRAAAGQHPYFWAEEEEELWVDLDEKRKEARWFSIK